MCDFSSPRNPASNWPNEASALNPDIFSVPYLAPHPIRPDPITAARLIRDYTGTEVVFNLATRDSGKSKLLEKLTRARDLGLENIVVLQGDADRGVTNAPDAGPFKPTELIRESKGQGWKFCLGAVADLANGVEKETELVHRKIDAGADFLIVQPTFDTKATESFLSGVSMTLPLFFGVQVLVKGGISFTPTPHPVQHRIDYEGAGVEIAVETIDRFLGLGIRCFYLIAPILPGGVRDYRMARQVMDSFTPRPTPDSPV